MERSEIRYFRYRGGAFELGKRTLLMGILNVTPDSFSDGGKYAERRAAFERALEIEKDGADILDIGAESTRPGSLPVSDDEQCARLLPLLKDLREKLRIPISIDTRSCRVASECLKEGAHVINDVSGLRDGAELAEICAKYSAGLVIMHMRGTPETMQKDVGYDDVVGEVARSLKSSVELAQDAGVSREQILVDPGLGFGKSFDQNYMLMGSLASFMELAGGVLVGPSRKAFTGELSGLPADERQFSTAAAVAICVLNGADVLRVHDVSEMRQVA
ncbi:dihydropteroate synthase, partial [bacterium]|nr:dihydropteroate synthase [bacterium]